MRNVRPYRTNGETNAHATQDGNPVIIEAAPSVLVGANQNEKYMISVQGPLQVVRRRFWVIAITALLLVGFTVGFSLVQKPVYEASIKILIGQKPGSAAPINLGSDVSGLQQLTQTMVEVIGTRPVAAEVINRLDLRKSPEELLDNLSVEQTGTTQVIEVSYADTSPEQSKRIVNEVGEVFSERVADASPTTNAITAEVWESAVMPAVPVGPDPISNGLLALVIGGLLGTGLAFLLEQLDDSWRLPEELEQVSGVPTFGLIPKFEQHRVKKVPRSKDAATGREMSK